MKLKSALIIVASFISFAAFAQQTQSVAAQLLNEANLRLIEVATKLDDATKRAEAAEKELRELKAKSATPAK